jgi:hypothetical protein
MTIERRDFLKGLGAGAVALALARLPLPASALPVPADMDTDGFHPARSRSDRFTVPQGLGGKYLISGFMVFQPSDQVRTGRIMRMRELSRNVLGPPEKVAQIAFAPGDTQLGRLDALVDLVPGDEVWLDAPGDHSVSLGRLWPAIGPGPLPPGEYEARFFQSL